MQQTLAYKAGTVLNAGLAPRPVTMDDIDNGLGQEGLTSESPAVLAYVRAITLRQGDVQRIVLTGPNGPLLDHSEPPLPSNKDQVYLAFGRKRPAGRGNAGPYAATYTVTRNGSVVVQRTVLQQIGPPPTEDGKSDRR